MQEIQSRNSNCPKADVGVLVLELTKYSHLPLTLSLKWVWWSTVKDPENAHKVLCGFRRTNRGWVSMWAARGDLSAPFALLTVWEIQSHFAVSKKGFFFSFFLTSTGSIILSACPYFKGLDHVQSLFPKTRLYHISSSNSQLSTIYFLFSDKKKNLFFNLMLWKKLLVSCLYTNTSILGGYSCSL